jgi:hypothetical protein
MSKNQLFWIRGCLLSFFPYSIVAGFFWGYLAHNIPPFPASIPAEELAQYFRDHAFSMRLGYAVSEVFWSMLMVWAVGAFCIMRWVEGGDGVLSYIQLFGGALTRFTAVAFERAPRAFCRATMVYCFSSS